MLRMNTEMKKILTDADDHSFTNEIQLFLEEIISKTKILKDCVIYDNEGINETDINWNIVSKYIHDLTEYEVALQ